MYRPISNSNNTPKAAIKNPQDPDRGQSSHSSVNFITVKSVYHTRIQYRGIANSWGSVWFRAKQAKITITSLKGGVFATLQLLWDSKTYKNLKILIDKSQVTRNGNTREKNTECQFLET
jgi:hypothetical protein